MCDLFEKIYLCFSRPDSVSKISNHPTNHRNVSTIAAFLTSELYMTQLFCKLESDTPIFCGSCALKFCLQSVAAGVQHHISVPLCLLASSPASPGLRMWLNRRRAICPGALCKGYRTPSLERHCGDPAPGW